MTSQVEQVALEIQEAKDAVAKAETLQKLMKTRAFKEIFEKELFENEPKKLARAFASPSPNQREHAQNMMITIGSLQTWISAVLGYGEHCKASLEEYELQQQALLTEE